tara:strand:+ start:2509 stop:2676 length:168 start_codon:yes stop_codon:yes gene_type:complete
MIRHDENRAQGFISRILTNLISIKVKTEDGGLTNLQRDLWQQRKEKIVFLMGKFS